VDESTDVVDKAQLAIFISDMHINFNITEELAALCSMKGSITGTELYEQIMRVIEKFNLNLNKLQGITTDAAPAMVGKKNGLTASTTGELEKRTGQASHLVLCHCIVHQQSLCSQVININHVMNIVVSTVNIIRSRLFNHRQFRELLIDTEADCGDVIYHSEVRWLSRGKVLKRIYNLRKEVQLFMDMKGKPLPEYSEENWISDFAFLVDMTPTSE
jgi:hypothetical protein